MIKILSTKNLDFRESFNTILQRANIDMDNVLPQVLEVLKDIRRRGEEALLELVSKYDNWNPKSLDDLKIDMNEAKDAYDKLDSNIKDSLKIAYDRIYDFHDSTKPKGFIKYDNLNNQYLYKYYHPILESSS